MAHLVGDRLPPTGEDAGQRNAEIRIGERQFVREIVERAAAYIALLFELRRHRLEHGAHALARRGRRPQRGDPGFLDRRRYSLLDHRQRQRLLGREMVMQRAAADAARRHQIAEAGCVIAARLEGVFRHVEHTAPHAFGVVGAFFAHRHLLHLPLSEKVPERSEGG